jgi:chromosome segregation ATPase
MTAAALEIPDTVAAALADWVQRRAEDVASGPRSALAQAQQELDGLRAELADTAAARAAVQEQLAARDAEIEQLNAELRNARSIATDALVGKAKDQLAIEGKDAQLADLRGQLERQLATQATLSDARLAAEMELVGAVTARDNYAAEIKDLRNRLAARAA